MPVCPDISGMLSGCYKNHQEIAQMTKGAFIQFLGENGVSVFQYDNPAEFLKDVANAYGC